MITSRPHRFPRTSWQWALSTGVAVILLVGTAAQSQAAVVSRNILKSFFTPGAKPTSAQFADLIDNMLSAGDDRHLLGLKQYDPTRTYLGGDILGAGTAIDANMIFGPADGLVDARAGHSGFLALSEGSAPDPHYGYLQITAGRPSDVYPMFVEYFVYDDQANTPLVTTSVPEPSTFVLICVGAIGLAHRCWRRRK